MPVDRFGLELAELRRAHLEAGSRGVPLDAVLEERPTDVSRREFLKRGAIAGAAFGASLAVPAAFAPDANAATAPDVIVVGGGLAGMTAAYRMWKKAGWSVKVYEAEDHIGGRTDTVRGLPGGQWAEACGMGVNTYDDTIRSLIAELNLSLINTWSNWPGGRGVYNFDGLAYTRDEVRAQIQAVWNRAAKQMEGIQWPLTYKNANRAARQWDRMTVKEWIDQYVPGGSAGVLGQYFDVYFSGLYAGPIDQASAIHFIVDQGWKWPKGYDEKYTVAGGMDLVCTAMENRMPAGSVQYEHALVAIVENGNGTYTCTFDNLGTPVVVNADRVVLALPFSALRDVDTSAAGFRARKRRAIQNIDLGPLIKMMFQFTGKPWETDPVDPRNGSSMSDLVTGWTWQGHAHLPGTQGLIIALTGEPWASSFPGEPHLGVVSNAVRDQVLAAFETLLGPGVTPLYSVGYLHNLPQDPWAKGAYSYYKAGDFTDLAGVEMEREGGVHFAGEHTAPYVRRATMDGAVVTGERAAHEILKACGEI